MGMIPAEQTIAIIEATKSDPNYWQIALVALIGIIPGLIWVFMKMKKKG